MPEAITQPEASTQSLSEIERLVDTVVAPTKTFRDITRSAAWWGPIVVLIIINIAFSWTVQKKVGWDQAYENQIRFNPKAEQRIEQLQANAPDRAAAMQKASVMGTEFTSYGRPIILLIMTAITALLVWPTINFGFGGRAKYSTVFAVFLYTLLISEGLRYVLATIVLWAGASSDSFFLPNPVGTNLGYWLLGGDSPYWLVVLGMFLDITGIWALVLAVVGCSIVGKVKRSSAAIAVVGWWAIFVLLITGLSAI